MNPEEQKKIEGIAKIRNEVIHKLNVKLVREVIQEIQTKLGWSCVQNVLWNISKKGVRNKDPGKDKVKKVGRQKTNSVG